MKSESEQLTDAAIYMADLERRMNSPDGDIDRLAADVASLRQEIRAVMSEVQGVHSELRKTAKTDDLIKLFVGLCVIIGAIRQFGWG